MHEEWKARGELLQEVNALRDRIAQLEQNQNGVQANEINGGDGTLGILLDNITEGILFIDAMSRKLIAGNKVSCNILGCKQDSIVNLCLEDVHPKKETDHIFERIERLAGGKSSLVNNLPIKNHDGTIQFKDVTFIPLTLAGRKYILSVLRESSPQQTEPHDPPGDSDHQLQSPHLTATEINILKLIANGLSSKEIAQLLHRSPRTIQNHRAHLMKKLNVENSVELVRQAEALGLVESPAEP